MWHSLIISSVSTFGLMLFQQIQHIFIFLSCGTRIIPRSIILTLYYSVFSPFQLSLKTTRLMRCWTTQPKKHHRENKIRKPAVEECSENIASHVWQKHFETEVWVVFTNKTVQSISEQTWKEGAESHTSPFSFSAVMMKFLLVCDDSVQQTRGGKCLHFISTHSTFVVAFWN